MALFITLLVAGAFATAGFIHKQTYRHPRDVTAPYRKAEKAETHGPTSMLTP